MSRHPLDLFSLVAGVLVVGTAVVLLVPGLGLETLGRLTPVAIIALGLAVLVSARPAHDTASDDGPDASPGEGNVQPTAGTTTERAPQYDTTAYDATEHHDDTARLDLPADEATERLDDDVRYR